MTVEQWQTLGIVCGAALAALTLAGVLHRKVVRPVWRAMWRLIRRLGEMADQFLGDRDKGIPSVPERIKALETKMEEHLSWHDPRDRANGPQPARRRAGPPK